MDRLHQLGKKQENGKRWILEVTWNDGGGELDELLCKSFSQLIGTLSRFIRTDEEGNLSDYLNLNESDRITIVAKEIDEQDFLDIFYERD